MANSPLNGFLSRLRCTLAPTKTKDLSDRELLESFVTRRDEVAFEVLVWRHSGVVVGACRRLLRNSQDVEDVFQATFLALTRSASAIDKGETVASWLYKVAYRLSLRVRARASRDAATPLDPVMPVVGAILDEPSYDLRRALDEEIYRLPEKYRAATVLYYLQGKTTSEAAQQLGCARGTVCSRLSWARKRLRHRLTKRGLAPALAGLALVPSGGQASAGLIGTTVKAATLFVSGKTAPGVLSAQVVILAQGALRTMIVTKVKVVAVALLILGSLGTGVGLSVRHAWAVEAPAADRPVLVSTDSGSVRLPKDMPGKLGIRVATVQARPADGREIRLSGSTALEPASISRVRARFAPVRVLEIGMAPEGPTGGSSGKPARELRAGDRVRKGDLLAVLSSTAVADAKGDLLIALLRRTLDQAILSIATHKKDSVPQASLVEAQRQVAADENAIERILNKLRTWQISEEDITTVIKVAEEMGKRNGKRDQISDKNWARVEVRAPRDGVVVERNLHRDEIIGDDTVNLFQIASTKRLMILAEVPKHDLSVLLALPRERQRWTVRTVGTTPTSIETVLHIIDGDKSKALATGTIENSEGLLRAGQYISASIKLNTEPGEVVVPAGAVVEENGQSFVFVQPDTEKPYYVPRRVAVVRRGHDTVHVRVRLTPEQMRQGFQSIRPGERIVTTGSLELKAILADRCTAAAAKTTVK